VSSVRRCSRIGTAGEAAEPLRGAPFPISGLRRVKKPTVRRLLHGQSVPRRRRSGPGVAVQARLPVPGHDHRPLRRVGVLVMLFILGVVIRATQGHCSVASGGAGAASSPPAPRRGATVSPAASPGPSAVWNEHRGEGLETLNQWLFYVRRHTCADGSFEWYVLNGHTRRPASNFFPTRAAAVVERQERFAQTHPEGVFHP
jgi:hypothetical protein